MTRDVEGLLTVQWQIITITGVAVITEVEVEYLDRSAVC